MLPTQNNLSYYDKCVCAQVVEVFQKYIPGLKPGRNNIFPQPIIRVLPSPGPVEVLTFEIIEIEQGLIDGNWKSLKYMSHEELGYSWQDLEEIVVLISGDQLTMDQYQSLRTLTANDLIWEHFG